MSKALASKVSPVPKALHPRIRPAKSKPKIHVDEYKLRIYKSLVSASKGADERFPNLTHLTKEAPPLVGFTCGNIQMEGCLTRNENVRIHSCEKGTPCTVMSNIEETSVVWIQPIVAHLTNGHDVAEVGIGGSGGDLIGEQDLRNLTPEEIDSLIKL